MKSVNLRPALLTVLMLLAAFSRIVPHMPNFSPLNAIALFAAAHFTKSWQALVVPLAATWLSDLFLNNVTYAQPGQAFVWVYPGFYWQYAAYALIAFGALRLFSRGHSRWRVAVGVLSGGLTFFAISNFGVWFSGGLYPQTLQGLLACYVAALPFYQGTLLGDATYSLLLFGGFHLLQARFPQLAASPPLRWQGASSR